MEGKIYGAIAGIMQEGYSIGKEKRNAQQGFMYRGIDDVMNVFQPLLSKHKVFIVPEVLEQTREERVSGKGNNLLYSVLRMRYTFFADDGSSVSAVVVGEGMDSGDKASNKAMAVAMKYAMFQVFCIPTEEMKDPDAETPPESTKAPPKSKVPIPPKHDAPPKEDHPEIGHPVCTQCRKVIQGTMHNGKTIPAEEIAKNTTATYGAPLCWECATEAKMKKEAAIEALKNANAQS